MTGEIVLRNVYNVMQGHRAQNYGKKPLFLYLSHQEFYSLKQTDEFVNENSPTYPYDEPQKFKIFGMEIVKVDRRDGFIRVGN